MIAYDLNEHETALIEALRAGDSYKFGTEVSRAFDALWNDPSRPPYTPPHKSKLYLWLIRHGIELQWGNHVDGIGGFERRLCVGINHRFFGVNVLIDPFVVVQEDELNTPHAEIAAQYEKGGW